MSLAFVQETKLEQWRAATALTKEPGTIAWLDELQPGDVFYDIGANIGIYTIYAAAKVGPTGHVYAVEPHLANAVSLLKNIEANGFQNRVTVCTVPLSDRAWLVPFYYHDLTSGASGSQVCVSVGENGPFDPVACEWKWAMPLSVLSRGWHAPTAVKVDVDGHEAAIVAGSEGVRPRSWQIEVHPGQERFIDFHLGLYASRSTHYTSNGQKAIDKGADPATVTRNVIYRRQA